jgi:uncharacterized protein with GYD domain
LRHQGSGRARKGISIVLPPISWTPNSALDTNRFGPNQTSAETKPFMQHYLFQASYTDKAWATLTKKPQNREPIIREAIERLGGKLENVWLSLGEYDVIAICQMPDIIGAAAFSIAAAAGGALKSAKTTPLLSSAEGAEALKRAAKAGYRPPK